MGETPIANDVPGHHRGAGEAAQLGAARVGRGVVVLQNRGHRAGRAASCVVDPGSLEARPAEVRAVRPVWAPVVDLLATTLADVADGDRALQRVEGEPIRIAQAEREDLVEAGLPDERIAARNPIGDSPDASAVLRLADLSAPGKRVDPKELA